MEDIKLNVRVIEDNRISITTFGALFGRQIFKAQRVPCNLTFNKDARIAEENNGLTTNRSTYRYKIVPIDIIGLNLDKDIDGTNVIVINKGRTDESGESIEIRCPIDCSKFTKEVTTENITDALNKKGTSDVFFANAKKLVETLNPSNINEVSRIENIISELNKQKEMILHTMEYNKNSVENYYRQLDKTKEHVKITINQE